jgi:hypothetical protein
MLDRTADEAYAMILSALREHGLSWVVEQIGDQVRAGKPITRVVATASPSGSHRYSDEVSPARRPRRERLTATEPYTSGERLTLALDAIERAVIQTADLEDEVLRLAHPGESEPPASSGACLTSGGCTQRSPRATAPSSAVATVPDWRW